MYNQRWEDHMLNTPSFQMLQNTGTSAPIASPEATPSVDPNGPGVEAYNNQIKSAEERLTSILNEQPDINYEQKFSELMKDTQNRPVEPHPVSKPGDVASSFAYALGAPGTAPGLLHEKIMKHDTEYAQKERDLMSLKQAILHGSIQQELSKGNFKVALKQSEALEELQRATKDRERYLDTQKALTLQNAKAEDAKKLIKEKAKQLGSEFHLDEKKQLSVMEAGLRYRAMLGDQPGLIPGTSRYDDATMDQKTNDYMRQVVEGLGGKIAGTSNVKLPTGSVTPAEGTTTETPGAAKSKQAADILSKIRSTKK